MTVAADSTPVAGDAADQHNSRRTCRQTHERLTVRTTEEQREAIESLVTADVYPNRSEAVRAGIEAIVERHGPGETDGERE